MCRLCNCWCRWQYNKVTGESYLARCRSCLDEEQRRREGFIGFVVFSSLVIAGIVALFVVTR